MNNINHKPDFPSLVAFGVLCDKIPEYVNQTGQLGSSDFQIFTVNLFCLSKEDFSNYSALRLKPYVQKAMEICSHCSPAWPTNFYDFAINLLMGKEKMTKSEVDGFIKEFLNKNSPKEDNWQLTFIEGEAIICNKQWRENYFNNAEVEDPDEAGFPYKLMVGRDGFIQLVKTIHSLRVN